MPLLNYTTRVPAARTIGEMQSKLARAGAVRIATTYEDSEPSGLSFAIETSYGMQIFELPVEWRSVDKVLLEQGVWRDEAHSKRVAWRILKDWLEAQLALIETQMVTLDQVMLPYMKTQGGLTVYELVRDQQLAITQGSA